MDVQMCFVLFILVCFFFIFDYLFYQYFKVFVYLFEQVQYNLLSFFFGWVSGFQDSNSCWVIIFFYYGFKEVEENWFKYFLLDVVL